MRNVMSDISRIVSFALLHGLVHCVLITQVHAQPKGQPIQQNGFEYHLILAKDGHLSLHGKRIKDDQSADWRIEKFDTQQGSVIKQHVLAPYLDTGIFAVVIVKSETAQKAFVLMFADEDLADLDSGTVRVNAREIHSSGSPFHILAVNGSFQGDGMVVVLGTLANRGGYREVEAAVVVLDDCPIINIDASLKSVLTRQAKK
jgi:hypothetical protein